MLEVAQSTEKEIDSTEESKQPMDGFKEYLVVKKKDNASIIVNIALIIHTTLKRIL